jgi:putative ABC transport system permease protein
VLAIALSRQWKPVMNPLVAVGEVFLGAVVGLVAGGFPTRNAMRIEPVAALRGS